jgi:hypothetical protein
MKTLLTVLALSILWTASAQAALIYNESSYPGGDFPGSGFPNIGTLGAGLNTITGAVHGAFSGVPQDDYEDTFSVTLPAGMVIVSGQLVITNFTYGGLLLTMNGSAIEPLNVTTTINANGTYTLTANVPYSTSGSLNVDIQSSDS